MDLEKYARQVREGDAGAALDSLARSRTGAELAAKVDGEKLTRAAQIGDMKALGQMLQGILATPEGKQFAAQVQKAVKRDGR